VPRCRDLKEYRRRAEEHVEERRRQAFAHYRQLHNQGQ
jgi:E1A/CREB-binding protein